MLISYNMFNWFSNSKKENGKSNQSKASESRNQKTKSIGIILFESIHLYSFEFLWNGIKKNAISIILLLSIL